MQKFLKDFDRERRKISPQKIREVCKKLNLSKELTESLIDYRKEHDMIALKEGNIWDFWTNLSRYLADNPDQIAELLQLPLNPVKTLTKLWKIPSKNKHFIHRTQLREMEKGLSKQEAHVVLCHRLGGIENPVSLRVCLEKA